MRAPPSILGAAALLLPQPISDDAPIIMARICGDTRPGLPLPTKPPLPAPDAPEQPCDQACHLGGCRRRAHG